MTASAPPAAAPAPAPAPRIAAVRVAGEDKPISAQQRRELGVSSTEPVRYRRVRLMCGEVVLSEADNWYVPGRLSAQMNTELDTTDIPFGRVVTLLHVRRHTLEAKLLWMPLPEGWEMDLEAAVAGATDSPPPAAVLEHRAVLSLPDGTPISEVIETYTNNVLAFPAPRPLECADADQPPRGHQAFRP
jgi:hypothetical protein